MTLEDLRQLVKGLPSISEDVKWEDNFCGLIGGKIFVMFGLNAPFRINFKVTEEDFAELTGREDIIQAPHLARGHWVQVRQAGILTRKEWQDYLSGSYHLVARKLPKKTRKELGI